MKISSAGWKGKRNVLKQLWLFFFSLVLPKLDVPWSHLIIFEFLTSNCWLFLTALEALQSFEAVVGFYSRTVFNNDFQIFILFYFLSNLCLERVLFFPFYMHFSLDCYWFCFGWELLSPRLPHTLSDTGLCVIVPRFRWMQSWRISWSQMKHWSARSLVIAIVPCRMPMDAEMMWFLHGAAEMYWFIFPAVAARHFERSTIRSRSFKKINKAFSVLRRTKSGSAVSNQADREREAVGNSVPGEEGNALFSLCYHLKWGRGPCACGNWLTVIDMPFMWWGVND